MSTTFPYIVWVGDKASETDELTGKNVDLAPKWGIGVLMDVALARDTFESVLPLVVEVCREVLVCRDAVRGDGDIHEGL